jgi:SAM-dependent methyltransferase
MTWSARQKFMRQLNSLERDPRPGAVACFLHTIDLDSGAGAHSLAISGRQDAGANRAAAGQTRAAAIPLRAPELASTRDDEDVRTRPGCFVSGGIDGRLPFRAGTFSVVHAGAAMDDCSDVRRLVDEVYRVLRPGGRAIMVAHTGSSLHYWRDIILDAGVRQGLLEQWSASEIMERHRTGRIPGMDPSFRVHLIEDIAGLFAAFDAVEITAHDADAARVPRWLRWFPASVAASMAYGCVVVKADKPAGPS